MTLKDLFNKACNEISDVFKHCPFIYELARKCNHIVELGGNSEAITVSLLAAQPSRLHIISKNKNNLSKLQKTLNPVKKDTYVIYEHNDSLKTQTPATDLIVFDTYHSYSQLRSELMRHAGNSTRYLVFPSTHAFSMHGEDGHAPGITQAIYDFAKDNEEWTVIYNETINNGLMVLEREPTTGPDFERLYTMVSFDMPDVRYVERYVVGMKDPNNYITPEELEIYAEKQVQRLNRALRYGIIIGVERNFTTITIGDKEVQLGYLVYHVGFRNRPAGK